MTTISAMIPHNVETVETDFAVTVGLMQELGDELNEGVPSSAESYQHGLRQHLIAMASNLIASIRAADALFGVTDDLGIFGADAGLVPAE